MKECFLSSLVFASFNAVFGIFSNVTPIRWTRILSSGDPGLSVHFRQVLPRHYDEFAFRLRDHRIFPIFLTRNVTHCLMASSATIQMHIDGFARLKSLTVLQEVFKTSSGDFRQKG